MEALVLRVKDTPPHHRVEASQSGDQQMQTIRADRRPVAGLYDPAFDSALLECAAGLEQKQPRVLTHRVRLSVPCIAVFGQEAEPGPQNGQIRLPRPSGADTFHEPIPLVERHNELAVCIEHQPFVTRSARWVWELSRKPQSTRPVQTAELAARSSLGAHDGQHKCATSIIRE